MSVLVSASGSMLMLRLAAGLHLFVLLFLFFGDLRTAQASFWRQMTHVPDDLPHLVFFKENELFLTSSSDLQLWGCGFSARQFYLRGLDGALQNSALRCYRRNFAMRVNLEYALVWLVVRTLGALPRSLSRAVGMFVAVGAYAVMGRLRKVGMRNLQIAFPKMPQKEKRRIIFKLFVGFGRHLAEFCMFPRYTRENAGAVATYEGFENFDKARAAGRGVLFLTGHFGGWEIGSFVHSIFGNPMKIVVRRLDNPKVDALVERYRTLHGNETFAKEDFARGLLGAMKAGETVGILMDTNMTPPQGVFVDFFGTPACTAAGVARVALRSGAAVVPAFTIWDNLLRKYRVRFDPALTLVSTGNDEADAVANTALFTRVIQNYATHYPEQWLWVHRRWKTRPQGESPLY
ncbi:MAG: lysophospholipid acyltransferase family protein [Terriglobales bacterium]